MNKSIVLSAVGATLLITAGCATAPTRDNTLEAARAMVNQVENSPTAGEVAATEVEQAHNALRAADELAKKHASTTEIAHQAYLAQVHAQIAQEQIATAQAKQVVSRADGERQKVLLEADAARKTQQANLSSAQAAAATQRAAAANEQAADAQQRAQLLEKQLADLNAKKTDRGMVLTLGDVLFDTGKATLKPGAQSTIDRLAAFLKNSQDSTVVIEGHTDSVGSDDYNMGLSQRRAEAVKNALMERNISGDRVAAVGKGKSEPIASNDNAGGRQQNRRVEIVIQNSNQSSATASG